MCIPHLLYIGLDIGYNSFDNIIIYYILVYPTGGKDMRVETLQKKP